MRTLVAHLVRFTLFAMPAAAAAAGPIATPPRPVTDPRSIESPRANPADPPSVASLFLSAHSWDAVVTPDGQDLIYSADTTGRMNLWRASLAGGEVVRLTTSNERQLELEVSPDSNTVIFAQDLGGAEMFDLYAVPRAGGEPTNLTNTPAATETGAVFSRDGRQLAYSQRLQSAASANVVVMDLASKAAQVLTDERQPDRQWSVIAFSGDARYVYAKRADIVGKESDLWKIEIATRVAKPVFRGLRSKANAATDVTADGRYIALTTDSPQGIRQAAIYDVETARLKLLAPSPWEQSARRFSGEGRTLLFVTNIDGRSVVQRYDVATGRVTAIDLPPGVNSDWFGHLPALTADGRVVFPHESGSRSIDYWVHDPVSGRSTKITQLAEKSSLTVPETRVVTYPSYDGTLISAILWVPANAKRDGRNPAVVIAHGGPTGQTEDRYSSDAVALVTRGYFVIAPNPRGSTGYGTVFMNANVRDLGGGDLQDYVAGTRFLVDSGYVDPTRIGIMGISYGGYMTIMAIGRAPDVFAAGAETCGITNWYSMHERGSPALRAYQEGLIGHPVRDRDVYERTSPLTYLDQVKAPLLVLQGDNDIRVPKYEAEQVVATLTKLGKTVEARYYPDEGHGLMKRENQVDALERTIAWFDRFLKRERAGVDALQWLEAPRSVEALAWASAQSSRSAVEIESSPNYAPIRAELQSALKASAPLSSVSLMGTRAVRFHRDAQHPHGRLQVAHLTGTAPGPWRTVLDVGDLREREGKPYELLGNSTIGPLPCAPPDYRRCLLPLSLGGGDEVEVREFDLESAAFVDGGYRTPVSRSSVAWIDADHVLIAHALGDSPRTISGWAAGVRLWRRGEPLESARLVYTAPATDAILVLARMGEGPRARGIVLRVLDYSTFELKLVDAAGNLTDVELPTKLKPFGLLGATARHLVVQLAEPADIDGRRLPAETLLAYDVQAGGAAPRVQVIYEPKTGEFLNDTMIGLATTRSDVHFVLTQSLVPRLVSASPRAGGWTVHESVVGKVGESMRVAGGDPSGDAITLETAGLLTPGRQEILRRGSRPVLIDSEPPAIDASRFVVELRKARAKDGILIDYFLLRPKKVESGKPVPTLMTGYGAFGISLAPGYFDSWVGGRSLQVWLARGGALALPAIRGGGERGEEWHRAAMREKRQVSYDDFAAVTEDLIASGFTRPRQLGVFGMSNGGLLSATMGLQRPDLYTAVVSDVPLSDMLRFPKMGMGAAWMDEYGNPDDPQAAKVLRTYSPLHIVRDGVAYPRFLITISTEDNRVGPGHARKLAARLEQAGANVSFIEDQEGGHGVTDPLSRPELVAKRMTFLVDALMSH